jgi:phosphate transport system substrate-binding protein
MNRSTALALALALSSASVAEAQVRGQTVDPATYRQMPAGDRAGLMTPDRGEATDGVASIVNVEGVKPGRLKLTATVLAEIYQGKITRWDAAQIASLNPGVALPHKAIVVVHSADTSPASQGFSSFLAARDPAYRPERVIGPAIHWSIGVSTTEDADVVKAVSSTANSIGFVEYDFARDHGLAPARLIDGRGLPTTKLAPPSTPHTATPAAERTPADVSYKSDLPADPPMNKAP